jgi:eukaryotic-like serine/threonine-protein kinase
VNGEDPKAKIFDVFLCHNSEDKPAVREISKKLAKEGIKPWLDVEQIPPGTFWQKELGEQIGSIKSAAVFVGNSGIGPWQDEEIQALLSQFVDRKCPVIPTILASANTTPELPWTLKNRHCVDFRVPDPDPLKQLIWGVTRQKPAAREPLIPGKDELAVSMRTSFERRLYPPLAQPPDQNQIAQLEILRRRVNEYWIDGVLKHSLYNEVLISLGKRQADEFIHAPWKYRVEVSDTVSSGPSADRDINAIYDATGLLLILGEPGSGKSTTLLDLTRTLLNRARDDIKERVPVVVNLSTWKDRQPLVDWISGELSEKYRVPRKIARFWLHNHYLLPLLDGLDEVETTLEPGCVAAINEFIEEFTPSGLVVCCRLNEYRWLPERLKLNAAICLEPFTKDEIAEFFSRGESELAALREAIDTDTVLQELAQTPLMLSIMSLAFEGAVCNEFAGQKGDSPEGRRKQIFRVYVEQMFQHKRADSVVFPKDKTISRLSWLAGKMRKDSQSVFLVEGLQPPWLGTTSRRAAYGAVVAVSLASVAFIIGLICILNFGVHSGLAGSLIILIGVSVGCWSLSPVRNGVVCGLIGGIVGGLNYVLMGVGIIDALSRGLCLGLAVGVIGGLGVGSLNKIILVESITWEWSQFWKKTVPGLILGLCIATPFGLAYGVNYGQSGLPRALIFGLGCLLICATATGVVGGFTDRVKVGKVTPNQGIRLSRQHSFVAFFVTGVIYGLIFALVYGFVYHRIFGIIDEKNQMVLLAVWTSLLGSVVALCVGLNRGGSAVIKHYALRLILWLNGYTALNIVKFLDHCAKLILLKKVGGGYIFTHRMLLDYFADIPAQDTSAKR